MFEVLQSFMNDLASLFGSVSMSDSAVLRRGSAITLFVDKVNIEYLTFNRRKYDMNLSLIFALKGEGLDVYKEADEKRAEIESIASGLFNFATLNTVEFSYIETQKILFVYLKMSVKGQEV